MRIAPVGFVLALSCGIALTDEFDAVVPKNLFLNETDLAVANSISEEGIYRSGFEANITPTVPTLVDIDPASPTTLQSLNCLASGATDPDSWTLPGYTYTWFNSDVIVGDESGILNTGLTTRDDRIRCEARAIDAEGGTSLPVSSNEVVIVNSPPSAPGVKLLPENPSPVNSLTCSILQASIDPDSDALIYLYRWYRNGVLLSNTTNILSSEETAAGDVCRCEIQAHDGFDHGPWGASLDLVVVED